MHQATSPYRIAGRPIGPDHPPYLIAELSGNHNGDLGRALALVDAAAAAGADAVKLQTYTADTMTIDHDSPDFRIAGGPWDGRTLYDLYGEASTPWEWHAALFERAKGHGLAAFSSPFDASAVAFLEGLGAPAYKIASFEIVDHPLIRTVAATGKPLIISTGMAEIAEIAEAVAVARGAGSEQLALLHCVSGYPSRPSEANLRTIPVMRDVFATLVGLSDHTLGPGVSVASVAMGACIIEKHLTLARVDGGPDAGFSLEPEEFKALAVGCRAAWEALGRVTFEREESETPNVRFRRSIYVVQDIAAGDVFTPENIRLIRPGFGLAPKHYADVLGNAAAVALTRGTALQFWHLQKPVDSSKKPFSTSGVIE